MLAVSGLAVWLLPLGCGRPADSVPLDSVPLDSVPLDSVPMVDPAHLLDEPAALRRALTRARGWFQAEPCVAQVELRSEISFDGVDVGGVYDPCSSSVGLVPAWTQQLVTHELSHAADFDHGVISYTQRATWSDVELASCLNCIDTRTRLIEILAQRCELGPCPVQLGRAVAQACADQLDGPDSLDLLLSDELLAYDGLDADIASLIGPVEGIQLAQRWGMKTICPLVRGPDGLYLLGSPDEDEALVSGNDSQDLDGLALPLLADQGPKAVLFPVDLTAGLQAGVGPWAGQKNIDSWSLSGGSPLVVWGWVEGPAQLA